MALGGMHCYWSFSLHMSGINGLPLQTQKADMIAVELEH